MREFTCSPDTTVYAPGYSEVGWRSVAAGDTLASVRARLGEPIYKWSHPDDEWWSYSVHGSQTDDYRERKVRFSLQGRVLEKHEECYID